MSHARIVNPAKNGEFWMAGAIIGYVASYLFDNMAVADVDPLIGPLFRRLPSLLLGMTLILGQGMTEQLNPTSPRFVGKPAITVFIISGVVTTLGTFSYYFALLFGGIVLTIPITQTLVLWGAIVGWFYLGETLNRKAILGIAIVLAGLILLSYGQSQGDTVREHWYYALPLALLSAMAWGVSGALWRDGQLRGAHQSTAIFLQFGVGMAFTLLVLATAGKLGAIREAATKDLLALLASGVLSGVLAIYCMFTALRLISVARVYTLNALTPLLAVVVGCAVFEEYINGLMLIGIVLTSVGVVLVQMAKPAEEQQAGNVTNNAPRNRTNRRGNLQ